ncbi:hypothetical protein BC936DRAFT_137058 [Jimgerdemannia flammicorona]|uniref:Uncharacterized protein n=1 Tax=Jimgerdemannia flammicorona TaxID=994334 RepID=A0A433CY55_9FUNG|nr:hypothetical protein BC936DRAFT_137058 [Jimgerdemannia flammicorona]
MPLTDILGERRMKVLSSSEASRDSIVLGFEEMMAEHPTRSIYSSMPLADQFRIWDFGYHAFNIFNQRLMESGRPESVMRLRGVG